MRRVNVGVIGGIGVGLLMIVLSVVKQKKLEKCTHPISAQVVDHSDFGDTEGHSYRPIVEYTYQRKKHRSDIDEVNSSKEKARQEYPIGKTVTVYIDPKNPNVCSSDPARDRNAQIVIIAVAILLIILSLSYLK